MFLSLSVQYQCTQCSDTPSLSLHWACYRRFFAPFPMLTVSFLGSLSRSRRSKEVLTLRASDRAIRPPVLISFSRRSRRSSLGLSAMNSATATAPMEQEKTGVKQQPHNAYSTPQQRHISTISHLHRIVLWRRVQVWAQSGWQSVRLLVYGLPHCPLSYGPDSESPDSVCMAERENENIPHIMLLSIYPSNHPFSSEMEGNVTPPENPGPTRGDSPSWMCNRGALWRHPDQKPKPPKLPPFDIFEFFKNYTVKILIQTS